MATDQAETVVGTFRERDNARNAIEDLKNAGFTEEQLGVVGKDKEVQEDVRTGHDDESGSSAAEGAKTGLGVGLGAGAGVGALWGAGILAGVIPGVGPAIAGGILGTLISSAVAAGAAGGVAGALVGLGMGESEAKQYEEHVKAGKILVTVRAAERKEQALEILRRHHAEDINTYGGPEGRGPSGQSATSEEKKYRKVPTH